MADASTFFFTASIFMAFFTAVAYLVNFVSTYRWAKEQTANAARSHRLRTRGALAAAQGGGGAATLVRDAVATTTMPTTPPNPPAFMAGRLGTMVGWFTTIALFMCIVFRAVAVQRPPWANMYEYCIAFAFAVMLAYLIFELRYRNRSVGVFAATASFLLLLFALYVGINYNQATPEATLIPALQDTPILAVHVSMAIFAYAFFTVAFGCAVINLLQGPANRHIWLPSAEVTDELGYKCIIIGFPLLALTLILGAYWANYAWGHYWSWDPKETAALSTWLVYAIYLHVRGMRGIKGSVSSWLLIAGFCATLFTLLGVSFLVPGLHSYAGVHG
jgi:cytochrome c-type biogenesis protein CcsB